MSDDLARVMAIFNDWLERAARSPEPIPQEEVRKVEEALEALRRIGAALSPPPLPPDVAGLVRRLRERKWVHASEGALDQEAALYIESLYGALMEAKLTAEKIIQMRGLGDGTLNERANKMAELAASILVDAGEEQMNSLTKEKIEKLRDDFKYLRPVADAYINTLCEMALRTEAAEREREIADDTAAHLSIDFADANARANEAEARVAVLEAALQFYARSSKDAYAVDNGHLAREALAPPAPEPEATWASDAEIREWCERIYREVGVTPALRRAYEFYKRNYTPPA